MEVKLEGQTKFQSTPPAWGATRMSFCSVFGLKFQSTPPAWGATLRQDSKVLPE